MILPRQKFFSKSEEKRKEAKRAGRVALVSTGASIATIPAALIADNKSVNFHDRAGELERRVHDYGFFGPKETSFHGIFSPEERDQLIKKAEKLKDKSIRADSRRMVYQFALPVAAGTAAVAGGVALGKHAKAKKLREKEEKEEASKKEN